MEFSPFSIISVLIYHRESLHIHTSPVLGWDYIVYRGSINENQKALGV